MRITPACAGKTTVKDRIGSSKRDHPRVCGKDSSGRRGSVPGQGSPPRVRERHSSSFFNHRQSGITPACAGKTICG